MSTKLRISTDRHVIYSMYKGWAWLHFHQDQFSYIIPDNASDYAGQICDLMKQHRDDPNQALDYVWQDLEVVRSIPDINAILTTIAECKPYDRRWTSQDVYDFGCTYLRTILKPNPWLYTEAGKVIKGTQDYVQFASPGSMFSILRGWGNRGQSWGDWSWDSEGAKLREKEPITFRILDNLERIYSDAPSWGDGLGMGTLSLHGELQLIEMADHGILPCPPLVDMMELKTTEKMS